SSGSDVRLLRYFFARTGKLDFLHKCTRWLRSCLLVNQGAVIFVYKEDLRLWRLNAQLALFKNTQDRLSTGVGHKIDEAFTIVRLERIDPDNRGDAFTDLLHSARAGDTRIRMHDKANILKALPLDDIHNISNMGVEIDVLAQQMRPLAKSGKCW